MATATDIDTKTLFEEAKAAGVTPEQLRESIKEVKAPCNAAQNALLDTACRYLENTHGADPLLDGLTRDADAMVLSPADQSFVAALQMAIANATARAVIERETTARAAQAQQEPVGEATQREHERREQSAATVNQRG